MGISITGGIKVPQGKFKVAVTPVPFSANAVTFDAANDYLTRGSGLTGQAATNFCLLSFWFQMNGSNGSNLKFFNGSTGRIDIFRINTDKFKFEVSSTAGSFVWQAETTATYTTSVNSGWNHVLVSMDVGAPNRRQMYVNDVSASLSTDNTGAGPIGWEVHSDFSVGASTAGATKLDGDLAEVYFNMAESLDLTTESNRRLFIDASLKPVDLGSDGSTPTGTAPIVFLSGDTSTWHTNLGPGLGFTENGALSDAPNSPSD